MPGFLQFLRPYRVLSRPESNLPDMLDRAPLIPGPLRRGTPEYRNMHERRAVTRLALQDMYPSHTVEHPYSGEILEDDLRRVVGAASFADPRREAIRAELSHLLPPNFSPDDFDYMSSLGSMTPGGGRSLMRSWREQNPDRGLAWYSLPNATPFYGRIGAQRFHGDDGLDFFLEPGQPVRRRGGLIREAA